MNLCKHQINPKYCKRCEIARRTAREKQWKKFGKLSPQQIKNWRDILATQIGSSAYLLPDRTIQKYRDDCQRKIIQKIT